MGPENWYQSRNPDFLQDRCHLLRSEARSTSCRTSAAVGSRSPRCASPASLRSTPGARRCGARRSTQPPHGARRRRRTPDARPRRTRAPARRSPRAPPTPRSPTLPRASVAERRHEARPVPVVQKDGFPAVAAGEDVVDRAGELDAGPAGHTTTVRPESPNYQEFLTDPNSSLRGQPYDREIHAASNAMAARGRWFGR